MNTLYRFTKDFSFPFSFSPFLLSSSLLPSLPFIFENGISPRSPGYLPSHGNLLVLGVYHHTHLPVSLHISVTRTVWSCCFAPSVQMSSERREQMTSGTF